MIDVIVGLAPFIFMLVFGSALTLIDIAYVKRRNEKELKKELDEKNNLQRLLRSYNQNRSKE